MTTIIWTPLPSEPLMVAQEHQTNQTASLVATVDPASAGASVPAPTVTTLAWTTDAPLPPSMTITTVANTLTVTAENFTGLFDLQIDYLETPFGGVQTVSLWQDVPPGTSDVVAMRPDDTNVKEISLAVTAIDENNAPLGTVDFVIAVYANYNVARDALKGFIHAGG